MKAETRVGARVRISSKAVDQRTQTPLDRRVGHVVKVTSKEYIVDIKGIGKLPFSAIELRPL